MQLISTDTVDRMATWLNGLDDERAVEQLIDEIAEEQPFLFAYLMAMGEGDFSEEEREVLLFLGIGVYQMAKQGPEQVPMVTEDHLDRLEQSNMSMLEYLSGESEAEFMQAVSGLLVDYPQPEVLRFVIESVFEEDEETVRPANQGVLVVFLKIVIDCLHEATDG
jgi:hypothetical protein